MSGTGRVMLFFVFLFSGVPFAGTGADLYRRRIRFFSSGKLQEKLARCCENSSGVAQDKEMSERWYNETKANSPENLSFQSQGADDAASQREE